MWRSAGNLAFILPSPLPDVGQHGAGGNPYLGILMMELEWD